jgi:prepilin-type N-terminal cleavage/methylation domain-containing protein/prepilin-type processing-associated H-X9-DG protein
MNRRIKAFTLIEMLVVISVIALLIAIILPSLNAVKASGKSVVCRSNIRQLTIANTGYASDNNGQYVLAARDIFGANNHRWYGVRDNSTDPFDTKRSALFPHLGSEVMDCPAKRRFKELSPLEAQYDAGAGGYGYNSIYIGSKICKTDYEDISCKDSARENEARNPSKTLMFADTAMAHDGDYIEYSFAEPRYFVRNGEELSEGWDPAPSIHFRHRKKASIAWADGHATSEKIGKSDVVNPDGTKPYEMNIGWFNPMDNSLFDLK